MIKNQTNNRTFLYGVGQMWNKMIKAILHNKKVLVSLQIYSYMGGGLQLLLLRIYDNPRF